MLDLNVFLSGLLLASSIMTMFIVFYSFSRKTSISIAFAHSFIAIAIYSFGYAMELYSYNLEEMIFWNGFQYLGLPFISASWFIMAMKYTNKDHLLEFKAVWFCIFLIPCLTLVFRFTNEFHHLFYVSLTYNTSHLFPLLHLEKGPWYFVHFLYDAACFLVANYLFLMQYLKSTGAIRTQCTLMFIGSIFPWISTLLDLLNLSPYGIDYGPFTTTIACVLFILALFRYELFKLKPLAKDKIFECTADGILILDENLKIIDFNPSASLIIPLLTLGSVGKHVQEVLQNQPVLIQSILNSTQVEYCDHHHDHESYYTVSTSPIISENNQIIGRIVTVSDISKYVHMMNQLNQLATTDELTGVYNRRYFFERSASELERSRRNHSPLSLLILDLDFFKEINDHYGHQAGDCVLKFVSSILMQNIRTIDILGRFGGEEYVILFPETKLQDAAIVAERIRKNMEDSSICYDGQVIKVRASFGLSGTDTVLDETLSDLLKKADQGLYLAKQDGRNCVRTKSLHSIDPLQ